MSTRESPRSASDDLGKVAIIAAHPGHELMVYHWMECHAPMYFCLTDGSGGSGESRLESTSRLLQGVDATRGEIFGRYSDKEVYRLLLNGRVDVFVELRDELADSLIAAEVTCVAGDAIEGFNPVHDICRGLIDGAVLAIRSRTGRVLQNYEFPLHAGLDESPVPSQTAAILVSLDAAALHRKLAAASSYPEMQGEVQAALHRFGAKAFAVEHLQESSTRLMMEQFERTPPRYEAYGLIRVGEGRYSEIVRYREHVLPVLLAIGDSG